MIDLSKRRSTFCNHWAQWIENGFNFHAIFAYSLGQKVFPTHNFFQKLSEFRAVWSKGLTHLSRSYPLGNKYHGNYEQVRVMLLQNLLNIQKNGICSEPKNHLKNMSWDSMDSKIHRSSPFPLLALGLFSGERFIQILWGVLRNAKFWNF